MALNSIAHCLQEVLHPNLSYGYKCHGKSYQQMHIFSISQDGSLVPTPSKEENIGSWN